MVACGFIPQHPANSQAGTKRFEKQQFFHSYNLYSNPMAFYNMNTMKFQKMSNFPRNRFLFDLLQTFSLMQFAGLLEAGIMCAFRNALLQISEECDEHTVLPYEAITIDAKVFPLLIYQNKYYIEVSK